MITLSQGYRQHAETPPKHREITHPAHPHDTLMISLQQGIDETLALLHRIDFLV